MIPSTLRSVYRYPSKIGRSIPSIARKTKEPARAFPRGACATALERHVWDTVKANVDSDIPAVEIRLRSRHHKKDGRSTAEEALRRRWPANRTLPSESRGTKVIGPMPPDQPEHTSPWNSHAEAGAFIAEQQPIRDSYERARHQMDDQARQAREIHCLNRRPTAAHL